MPNSLPPRASGESSVVQRSDATVVKPQHRSPFSDKRINFVVRRKLWPDFWQSLERRKSMRGEMTVREAWSCQEIWATQGRASLGGKGKGTGTGMTSPRQIMGWTWTCVLAPLTNPIRLCQILPFLQKYDALAQMQRPISFTSSGRLSFPGSCPRSFPSSQLPMDKRLFPSMGFVSRVSKGTPASRNPKKFFVFFSIVRATSPCQQANLIHPSVRF